MDQSPFQCTVPGRTKAVFLFLASLAMAGTYFLMPMPGAWIFSLLFISFALLFLLAALVPGKFQSGVVLSENGFEFRAPLRTPKLIPFTSIRRIEAFCGGDGDYGDEIHFLVHSRAGKSLVRGDMLVRSGLLQILVALPAFDRDAFRDAAEYQPHGLDLLFGKRFTVYENEQA